MAKPVFSCRRIIRESVILYGLRLHPEALKIVFRRDGAVVRRGAVRRSVAEGLVKSGGNSVERWISYEGQKSLPDNAMFWAVPSEALRRPEGRDNDLFDHVKDQGGHLNDPDWTLIHKSGWDHQVWGVDGKRVLIPIAVDLWETRFDLKAVDAHLKGRPGVVSFEIRENPVPPNWEISGRHLGRLVLDPSKMDIQDGTDVNRSWLEQAVVLGIWGPGLDLLGLHSLLR